MFFSYFCFINSKLAFDESRPMKIPNGLEIVLEYLIITVTCCSLSEFHSMMLNFMHIIRNVTFNDVALRTTSYMIVLRYGLSKSVIQR